MFLCSAAFVVYVLAGYPLLLAFLAKRRARPVHKEPLRKTVTVVLPVRNGAEWLERKLWSILALDYPRHLMQILVISDGSTDATEEIARRFAREGVELIALPASGKAVALNEGLQRATGEILFFTDVRQELDPACLSELVACFADPEVGVASGELIIRRGDTLEEANVGAYWKYEKWIRRHQSQIDSVCGATGCLYPMRTCVAQPLAPDTILHDVNLPLHAFFRGYRVIFEPKARAFDYPTSIHSEFRRKVRTQAGVYQTIAAFPQLLSGKNRMRLHFGSHKLGRLLLPWALLAALAASFGLPGVWSTLALGAQVGFYILVLCDFITPERFPGKRLTSLARAIFVLVTSAACAALFLFLPRQELWRTTQVNAPAEVPSEEVNVR